jgi:hypothetical protein
LLLMKVCYYYMLVPTKYHWNISFQEKLPSKYVVKNARSVTHFVWQKLYSYGKVKGKGVFFKLPISNVNNLCCQEAWNWGGIFKCTDDHIFEKTMKIELSSIPQAYTLKMVVKFLHNNSHQIILTVIKDRD